MNFQFAFTLSYLYIYMIGTGDFLWTDINTWSYIGTLISKIFELGNP